MRHEAIAMCLTKGKFQSTHPHGVRQGNVVEVPTQMATVSIHAPTRGATRTERGWIATVRFQSTHPHGVRQSLHRCRVADKGFNPRTHTGCDGQQPARCLSRTCFNPRTHTGCDAVRARPNWTPCSFNPRTHTGCDPLRAYSPSTGKRCFNPRTHTGCDPTATRR